MKKQAKEWNIETLWGKLAMISWGDSSNSPVLLVHGYMDNAATFSFLVDELLDDYYYVAFDIPGHGKSDPFPAGPQVTQAHMVDVLRRVVDHMGWKTFVCIAHSMAVVIGATYNTVYPGRISRMVCLDPGPPLRPYYELMHEPHVWYQLRYQYYYQHNYGKSASSKFYKYEDIVGLVAKNRQLSKRQAEVVLSRSLVAVGDGLYMLSWEPRVRLITPLAISEDILLHIKFKNTPPLLVTISTDDNSSGNSEAAKRYGTKIVDEYKKVKNCSIVTVIGSHDVHITNAKEIAGYINYFLKKEFCDTKSKL